MITPTDNVARSLRGNLLSDAAPLPVRCEWPYALSTGRYFSHGLPRWVHELVKVEREQTACSLAQACRRVAFFLRDLP